MGTAKARLQDNTGMTVVEVIIAAGIVTVGLVALSVAMTLGTSHIGESNLKTTATFLAQQGMEQIKNAQWTSTTPCPGKTTPPGCDSLGASPFDPPAVTPQWPDEDYNTIPIPPGATCPPCYPNFSRQVRIADCSKVSCSGIDKGTSGANTLRQVTVTVSFYPLAGTGQRGSTPESVQLVTLVTRRP